MHRYIYICTSDRHTSFFPGAAWTDHAPVPGMMDSSPGFKPLEKPSWKIGLKTMGFM